MTRPSVLLLTLMILVGGCSEDPEPGEKPSGEAPTPREVKPPAPRVDNPKGVVMPGDRRLLSREEVAKRLRVPLPAGDVTHTVHSGYTFGVWFESDEKQGDIVTWFKQNLDVLVPEFFEKTHLEQRWNKRQLAGYSIRMAQFIYADKPQQLNVTVTDYAAKSRRVIHMEVIDLDQAKPPKPPKPPR